MSALIITANNVTAAARFPQVQNETHAYRHFGGGMHPLVMLQHFMGTLHNGDLAVTVPTLGTVPCPGFTSTLRGRRPLSARQTQRFAPYWVNREKAMKALKVGAIFA